MTTCDIDVTLNRKFQEACCSVSNITLNQSVQLKHIKVPSHWPTCWTTLRTWYVMKHANQWTRSHKYTNRPTSSTILPSLTASKCWTANCMAEPASQSQNFLLTMWRHRNHPTSSIFSSIMVKHAEHCTDNVTLSWKHVGRHAWQNVVQHVGQCKGTISPHKTGIHKNSWNCSQ